MRRGEQRRHRSALGNAEQERIPRTDLVQHGDHIIHLMLKDGEISGPVGQANPTRIQQDQPRKGRESSEESGERGLLPLMLDVGEDPRQVHEVGPTLPENLIRDVNRTALRVSGLRSWLIHGPRSLAPKRSP
jgi:hypothetical protein